MSIVPERFQPNNSLLHRYDPRIKLIVTLLLIIGIVMTPTGAFPAYPLLWTVIGCLAIAGKVSVWRLGRLAGLALPFALTAATLLFTTPGNPIAAPLGLVITDSGLERFVSIVFKSWLAAQVALLVAMTTHFTQITWALNNLRVPQVLVAIIGFMYRYLFTLQQEAERMLRARAARCGRATGYRSGGRLLWRAQVAGGMVGSLFLSSYERSERVYAAMLARGYNGEIKAKVSSPLDWRAVALAGIPVLAVVIIQVMAHWWWGG
jgi:cobalt/nickel transport system permease protein